MAQIPSTSVSMDTIKSTLTSYGGSVSNDLLSFFTSGAKINIWSKWKPIIIPADFVDSEASMKSYNWGISIPSTYDLNAAYNGSSLSDWKHTLPTGGANAPYRIGDFRNYRPDATSPFHEISLDRTTAIAGETVTAILYCRMFNTSNENGMLGLNDLGTLSGCQAIFIKKSPSGALSTVLSSGTIADNHGSISATFPAFSTASSEKGTHYIMAALYKNGVYYPLPISKASVTVESYYANDYFEAPWGDAYYNSSGNTGYISLNQVIHAGSQTTSGPTFSRSLYAGATKNSMVGPLASGSVSVQKGQSGTLRITWNQNSTSWNTYKYLLQNDSIYIATSSSGSNATLINVSGG